MFRRFLARSQPCIRSLLQRSTRPKASTFRKLPSKMSTMGSVRGFSVTPGITDRGKYPAYVPLSLVPVGGQPVSLTADQAVAITETINSVLLYGLMATKRLQEVKELVVNPAVKFQLMLEALVEVRFHVLFCVRTRHHLPWLIGVGVTSWWFKVQLYSALPYGFESSPKGFQDFNMVG